MSNKNPFRKNPSEDVQSHVENWGKIKFKPKVFNGSDTKHFNSNKNKPFIRKYDNGKSNFHKNKDKFRFNEVARGAQPENSTPWNKYKDEIVFNQRDEKHAAQQANMESEEAKAHLKQREINYRKSLAEQKKKETVKWEDFGEDNEQIEDSQSRSTGSINRHKGNHPKNSKFKAKHNQSTTFQKKFGKTVSKPDIKEEFISKEVLENFDSKKLTYDQNDKLRSVITKTTMMSSQTSLRQVVFELKKKKRRQEKQMLKQ